MGVANAWPQVHRAADAYFDVRTGFPSVLSDAAGPVSSSPHSAKVIEISGWDELRQWAPRRKKKA